MFRKQYSIETKGDPLLKPFTSPISKADAKLMIYILTHLDHDYWFGEKKTAADMLKELGMNYCTTPIRLRGRLDREAAYLKELVEQEKLETRQTVRPL